MFSDVAITCRDCREAFMWSAHDQQWYAARNFSAPRRCKVCRALRKERELARQSPYPAYRGR